MEGVGLVCRRIKIRFDYIFKVLKKLFPTLNGSNSVFVEFPALCVGGRKKKKKKNTHSELELRLRRESS